MFGRSLASAYSCHVLHDNPNYVLTEPNVQPKALREGEKWCLFPLVLWVTGFWQAGFGAKSDGTRLFLASDIFVNVGLNFPFLVYSLSTVSLSPTQ